jgi:DNA-binding response OmpR family regulator
MLRKERDSMNNKRPQNKTVLVIDDECDLRKTLRLGLEAEGFDVVDAANQDEALCCLASHEIDIVTLDLGLGPDGGFGFARELREQRNIPVILVTGRTTPQDRVRGLENGADDYITKPFHFREIVMRLEQVLRRYELEANRGGEDMPGLIDFDHCVFDTRRRHVRKINGDDVDLTETELQLLEIFVQNPGRVLSRDDISLRLRGHEWSPLDRTIDGHVARLRRKLEPNGEGPQLIKSVRGVGYVFTGDVRPVTEASD